MKKVKIYAFINGRECVVAQNRMLEVHVEEDVQPKIEKRLRVVFNSRNRIQVSTFLKDFRCEDELVQRGTVLRSNRGSYV